MKKNQIPQTSDEIIREAMNAADAENVSENTNDVVTETVKSDKNDTIRNVAKKADDVIGKIKSTFHGFFTIAAIVAIVVGVVLFRTGNMQSITIALPVLNISYFRIAIAAVLVCAIGFVATSKK